MLSIDRARQFYMENRDKFPGMSMTDAVAQMVRSGTLPVAASAPTPAAEPAATMPVPTAAQVPPPAVPEQAAPPPPAYKSEYELALDAFNAANPMAAVAPAKKGPVDYAARARQAVTEGERDVLERNAAVAANAKIAPEIEKLLTTRETRFDDELAQIDKDRQQAIWMAIAQAGMKMAQSQSPYFLQALASGMEAGLNGYSEDKAKAAEKKARLQEAKEEIALKRYELRDKAIEKAINIGRTARQDLAAEQTLAKGALSQVLGEETIDEQIAGAALENQAKRAQIANIYDTISQRRAAGARADRAARAGGGGGGGIKLSQIGPIVNGAISENARLAEQLQDPVLSAQLTPDQKRQIKAKIQSNDQIIQYGRSIQRQKIGMGSEFKILGPA